MIRALLIFATTLGLLTACTGEQPAVEEIVVDNTPVTILEAGGTVTLSQQPGAELGGTHIAAWRDAQEYSLALSLAPPVHQSINLRYNPAITPVTIYLRAASDGEKLYLRLRWSDSTRDTATSRDEFVDAAAVQFALDGGPTTSYMMGTAATPVNIWYWKAGTANAENLAAGGFGSTTRLEGGQLSATSSYQDSGEWVVVFSRPLNQTDEHQVDLDQTPIHLALALWQGDAGQRDGLKHVSPGWVILQ